jgi:hypothetical protein
VRARLGITALCVAFIAAGVPATASAGSSDAAKRFEAAVAKVPIASVAKKKKCKPGRKLARRHGRLKCVKRKRRGSATDFFLDYSRAFQVALTDAAIVAGNDPNATGSGVGGCTRLSRIELNCLAFYNFNKPAAPDAGPWQCNWIVHVAITTDGTNRTGYFRTNFNCYPL